MQWVSSLQFNCIFADPKVGEKHILTKYSKRNSFQVTTDLLNSENLKAAIALLCNELQVWILLYYSWPKNG